jgi:hypothetical protein
VPSPSDKDKFICPHCGKSFQWRSPYIYTPRHIDKTARVTVVDHWNIPYSTGLMILSKDDVPKGEVEKYASEKAHFPFWPLEYLGKLWAKETWDD